jgi:large subunit ribosomal protein L29
MKTSKIRDLSLEELQARETELKEELFNLRFQHGTNQLENPMRMKQTKKDIARVLTVIKERQRAESQNEG